MLRRLLISISLSTFCFLSSWVELAQGETAYFARYHPFRTVLLPVLCWQALLTASLLAGWSLYRRTPLSRTAGGHYLFLAVCLWPLGMAVASIVLIAPVGLGGIIRNPVFYPAALVMALPVAVPAIARPARASRILRGFFLYAAPALAVIVVQGLRAALAFWPSAYVEGPLARATSTSPPGARVVWIILDELSENVAFEHRPAGLRLPAMDRLRAQSFHATAARAPGDATEVSLPALIVGETVTRAERGAPNLLMLRTESRAKPFSWSAEENVFDRARKLGANTALVGWYHPYGRLLSRSLTRCYWTAPRLLPGTEEPFGPEPFAATMAHRLRFALTQLPLVGRLPGLSPLLEQRTEKWLKFSYMLDRARETVADPQIGLALVHLPVPHPPGIYNRREARVGDGNYLDNMELADRSLDDLCRAIERAGLWERTAVLVSADHGWRIAHWRGSMWWTAEEEALAAEGRDNLGVPFLLRLPGGETGFRYDKPFNTVASADLVLAILSGHLRQPAEIPRWIQAQQQNYSSVTARSKDTSSVAPLRSSTSRPRVSNTVPMPTAPPMPAPMPAPRQPRSARPPIQAPLPARIATCATSRPRSGPCLTTFSVRSTFCSAPSDSTELRRGENLNVLPSARVVRVSRRMPSSARPETRPLRRTCATTPCT